jgi:hypothetical protein
MIDLAATLGPYLSEIGVGLASNAIYDTLKHCFNRGTQSRAGLEQAWPTA